MLCWPLNLIDNMINSDMHLICTIIWTFTYDQNQINLSVINWSGDMHCAVQYFVRKNYKGLQNRIRGPISAQTDVEKKFKRPLRWIKLILHFPSHELQWRSAPAA